MALFSLALAKSRQLAWRWNLTPIYYSWTTELAAARLRREDCLSPAQAIAKLRQTNFHVSERILSEALAADTERKRKGT
jgi:hypothetical protein